MIVEAVATSMVSECQLADELEEVGADLEEEINPLGLAACLSDRAGLDPKMRADPRELAGNNYNSQKDQQLDLCFQAIKE